MVVFFFNETRRDLFSSIAMSFETVGAGGDADEFTKTFAEQVVDLATQEQFRTDSRVVVQHGRGW